MRTTKRLVQVAGLAAGAVGVVAASVPDSGAGRVARGLRDRITRDLRYAVASAPGVMYRLAGRRPDPNVADDVLADRIRSSIGPVERHLDVPHVHVMVTDRVAVLHGEVPDNSDALRIERAVLRVSGVVGVESHLHHGLIAGDTRPSTGRAQNAPESQAHRKLVDAARAAGAGADAERAVRAVLSAFADRIPGDELAHVLAHLPADVQSLTRPSRVHGEPAPRLHTLPKLVAAIVADGGIDATRAEPITRSVIAALRGLVTDEARDVAAVLSVELRELWENEPNVEPKADHDTATA